MRFGKPQADFRQELGGAEPGRDRVERLGDHARGTIAGLMPTSAVSDRPEAKIGPVDKAVFVAAAARTRVARRRGAKAAPDPDIGFDRRRGHPHAGADASSIAANRTSSGIAGLANASDATRGAPSVHHNAAETG